MFNPDGERTLKEMGVIQDARPQARPQAVGTQSFFTRLLGIRSLTNSQDGATKTVSTLRSGNVQFQQQLKRSHSDVQQLQYLVEEKSPETSRLQQQLTHANRQLTRANDQQQRSDTENQHLVGTLREQVGILQQRVASLSATNRSSNPHEVEYWQVSPEEVSVREDEILGRGAWGYVAKGKFRGTTVAVKRVYPEILPQTTLD